MNLYRYYDSRGENAPRIYLETFEVTRETNACFVIKGYDGKDKFVLKHAEKRFAYPTLELAQRSYRIRKSWQVRHATALLQHAEICLAKAKDGTAWELHTTKLFEGFNFDTAP